MKPNKKLNTYGRTDELTTWSPPVDNPHSRNARREKDPR
jgi:hypothetical protein